MSRKRLTRNQHCSNFIRLVLNDIFSEYHPVYRKISLHLQSNETLAEKEISERGKGQYSFSGIKWTTGIYFCSLVVDNTIIETRKFSKE